MVKSGKSSVLVSPASKILPSYERFRNLGLNNLNGTIPEWKNFTRLVELFVLSELI